MFKKMIAGIFAFLLAAGLGFIIWASLTNPIQAEAVMALQSNDHVQVFTGQSAGNRIVFQPVGQQPETGLVFYPGGKVDYRAYAPYARAVATQGYLVVIARMPLNLAVFDSGEAGEVIKDYPQIKYWVVGGHSLGGSMAAHYTFQHPGRVQGLVLLASYPAGSDNLAHSGVKVLSIFGTNDGLATGLKIDAARLLLPADTRYMVIQGGNHAQFGNYGVQNGDHTATISREEQQQQAVDATINLLQSFAEQ